MTSDNHSGIVWSLLALIVITLAGVFLSLLVDKRLSFSSARNAVMREITDNERVLHALAAELAAREGELAASEAIAGSEAAELGDAEGLIPALRSEISSLAAEKSDLRKAIRETGKEFADYRERYRKAEWAAAAGERIDSLFLRTGRHFERVVINRVTPLGLEISHSRGSDRIDFKDLGGDLRSRFQWNEEERDAILGKGGGSTVSRHTTVPHESNAPEVPPAPRNMEVIAALRREISQWRTKISSLKSEYAIASSHESRRSVPGSLRTWGEQAANLRAEITRCEAQLLLSIEKLRTLSPADPLLQVAPR